MPSTKSLAQRKRDAKRTPCDPAVGNFIRLVRCSRGLSIQQMIVRMPARRDGTPWSPSIIYKVEQGQRTPSCELASAVAVALGFGTGPI